MRIRALVTLAFVAALAGAGPARAALDDFARCLTRAGARFYGTSWCPHCTAQRRMFGPAFRYVPYVECSVNGTAETTSECTQAGITGYPTWTFRDGSRETGEVSLERLAAKTGCPYERQRTAPPQIYDLPDARGVGVQKLPGAESVQIIDVE
jgi:hypothetical protein